MRTRVHGWIVTGVLLAVISGCAAERLHKEGMAAIERGDYEKGVTDLREAVAKDPSNIAYKLDYEARRDVAVHKLIGLADSARGMGHFDDATALYQRVLVIDPANVRARRGLDGIGADQRHGAAVADARKDFEHKDYASAEQKLHVVLNEDPNYAPAQELQSLINAAHGTAAGAPKLKTRENRNVSLQLRDAPTKMAFEVLQRETGINFILDKDVKSDSKTTIFVQDVPVDEAINLVLDQNGLARQVLAPNMVVVYPNNPTKQKEYEQQIVHTFYVTNAEPKDVESMLKTVLGAKNIFIDERSGSVMLRDTPEAVRMAEKLINSLDVAEPEVMLEIEVLEISDTKLQDLGILYPSTATLAPTPLGTGGSTSQAQLFLYDLFHQNSQTITVTPLSVTLNAMKQAGLTNTLASPRIRTRNKEKAKVLIGSRLPVITNTVTPTSSGAAVVTGSVQYLDVGLVLEVQPSVHLDGDVGVKVNLEVSNLIKQVTTPQGTIAYAIGTRNANTLLRLRDGETQILAGLIQDSDIRSSDTIPGLGDIPVIGKLFGTHHTDREKGEIVLSITPHIIRMQTRPSSDSTEFWYGSESHTHAAPYGSDGDGARSVPASMSSPPSALPAGGGVQPIAPSISPSAVSAPLGGSDTPQQSSVPPITRSAPVAPSPQGLAATALPVPIAAADAEAKHASGVAAAGTSALRLDGPAQVRVGEQFEVSVNMSSAQDITRMRSQLRFDAGVLQLTSATLGSLVPSAAGSPSIQARPGGAQLEVLTTPDDPVRGSGPLMILQFKALAARGTSIAAMVNVLGGNNVATGSSSAEPLRLSIQP
ncbi:MAG: type II and III secretion system protein [Proteobacteria bacterium]|nr:type II and III secretion system protein [Pseudomonadota bacterium]